MVVTNMVITIWRNLYVVIYYHCKLKHYEASR